MAHLPQIQFTFNERKATAAAALILRLSGGRMSYMRLIKLLYLAEREMLRRWNRPICGDYYVSMKFGPVMSNVLNLAKEHPAMAPQVWPQHIRGEPHYGVRLVADPGIGELSPAEIQVLEDVLKEHGQRNQWELSDLTHQFPEWREGVSCYPISPAELLRALGKSDEEIAEAALEAADTARFQELFSE